MVIKGVLNTVAPSLKVALGEKEKSFAQKRSNLAGEFPERVTEVPTALAGQCLCHLHCTHPGNWNPRMVELLHFIQVLLHLFVFFSGLTRKWPQRQKKAVFIFHDGISFS